MQFLLLLLLGLAFGAPLPFITEKGIQRRDVVSKIPNSLVLNFQEYSPPS
jgi:hypothetical protein